MGFSDQPAERFESFRLSRWALIVEDQRCVTGYGWGLGHRLTGECFGLSTQLKDHLVHRGQRLRALSELPSDLHPALGVMATRGLLVVDDTELRLETWANHQLVWPCLNPAVHVRQPDGRRMAIRLERTDICELPRQATPPRLVEEIVPETAAWFLSRTDGITTVGEAVRALASHLQVSEIDAWGRSLDAICWLTSPDRQLMRLRMPSHEVSERHGWQASDTVLQHYLLTGGIDRQKPADEFYKDRIDSTHWVFDWLETTVAHAFRFPSELFAGETFGGRFCESVLSRLSPASSGGSLSVVEVGGGLGYFARGFLDHLDAQGSGIDSSYTIVDISPNLLKAQARLLAEAGHDATMIQGTAPHIGLADEAVDVLISNEMIADLKCAAAERNASGGWQGPGATSIDRYGLDMTDAPNVVLVNDQALEFIHEIARLLRPGGLALVTEYGERDGFAEVVKHLDHDEFSIHFGHLAGYARQVGLEPSVLDMETFLGLHETDDLLMLTGQQEKLICLRAALRAHGYVPPYRAFTQQDFMDEYRAAVDPQYLGGLDWHRRRLGRHFGPDLAQFKVLIMNKPPAGSAN